MIKIILLLLAIFMIVIPQSNAAIIYGEINCLSCEFTPGDMVLIQNLNTGDVFHFPIDILRGKPRYSTAPKELPPAPYRIWIKTSLSQEKLRRFFDFEYDGKNQRVDIDLK